jgi:hypothetical protein
MDFQVVNSPAPPFQQRLDYSERISDSVLHTHSVGDLPDLAKLSVVQGTHDSAAVIAEFALGDLLAQTSAVARGATSPS